MSTELAEVELLKLELLRRRLSKSAKPSERAQATYVVPLADRDQPLPLSFAQQRLWFLDQLDHAAGSAYHIVAALRLVGRLDRSALQSTLNRIVARHENLRTTFVVVDGTPTQVIAPEHSGFLLIDHDLRDLDAGRQASAVATLGIDEARAPFDLAVGPLIRGRLLHVAQDEHVLLLTQHHIISDGWSTGILVKEVSALYTAFCQGQPDPLPPLAIQYADYAAWQRHWLHGDALQAQLDFWRMHLSGAPALLELPTDRPRSTLQTYAGDRVDVRLPAALTTQLRALSQRHGITVFMTLLAGWSVLLSRLSGQGEVVIGTPVANRQRSEIEPLIGFFVNTLALRIDLQSDPTVAELLAQVRKTTLDAYAHQDLPFEQVVETLQPERNVGYNPIFQAMLTLDNTPPGGRLALPGLELTLSESSYQKSHFDLRMLLHDAGADLGGVLDYSSDLFDHHTVERFTEYFITVLEGMARDDTQTIGRLPLLPDAERHQVLRSFNATTQDFPRERLIHELFEAQAVAQPDADAVMFEDQVLSYGALNRRANQVAHQLIALGVKPDERVAICVERSVEMIVGLLGILKAGAGYVPLDPAYPADRLAYMLDDSAPIAVLTQSALRASLPLLDAAAIAVIVLDDAALSLQPDTDPKRLQSDRHLAYVIYTSGSTGQPKGVMVEHRNAVNFWEVMRQTTHRDCAPRSRVALNAAFSFDMSLKGILQLLSGHCLVLIPQTIRANGPAMMDFIDRYRIDAMDSTPSQLEVLLAAGLIDKPGHRPVSVLLGGEAIGKAMWAKLKACTSTLFYNMYGPTECTVDATIVRIRDTHGGPVIGKPIANTQVYLLDAHRQPVPVGVPGELYLGGVQVARGYLNRAELTAERFLADPFSKEAGARLYKTGDLGRWLPDGTIEYLGRNDFQVKIRGFRIELGEIEAKLTACAGVREAVVIAREEASGDKRLVAYVVPDEGTELVVSDLRSALSQGLAEYMIPSAFVCMDALPLTPNGKLDRKALPAPDQSSLASRVYAAPIGDVEQTIAAIWQSLLGVERVGRNDHFFELGGHSLLAVQMVTRLRETLGAEIQLREVFAQPTLADMAKTLTVTDQSALLPIARADRGAPLPLSWAQQRLWFLDQIDHVAGAAYHISAAFRLSGALNRSILQATLDHIVARHENLRTTFVVVDGTPTQVIAPEHSSFLLIDHDLGEQDAATQAAAIDALGVDEASAAFNLATGPLIRGHLLRLGDHEHVLQVTQHHIVTDGWSLGILVKEVSALYTAFCQGQPDPLPPLAIQYADYAAWQRHWLHGDALQAQLDFWRMHLSGAPALLELPTDRPRSTLQTYAGDRMAIRMPDELTVALRSFAKRHDGTLFMALLAGWSVLLSRLSGQGEVVVGTPVANRPRSEVEPLIGFFLNTLALRVDLQSDPTVAELLAQVRKTTLDAYAHQDLPFEQVVETLQPVRSFSYNPLFQVMLTLDNTPPGGHPQLHDLVLTQVEARYQKAHFDLRLLLHDAGEELSGELEYSSDLFDRPSVERMFGYWLTLLNAMLIDDALPIGRLPLLPDAERHQVLRSFNATTQDFPRERLIHELFEAQAVAQPDADAVMFEDQVLSYGALNRRANQVAHQLIALGVKPDERVAICVERNVEMIVGLLGILKAGAGYVPLDPAYPADRLAYMLDDSAPIAVLTQSALRSSLPLLDAAAIAVIVLDDAALSLQPDTDPKRLQSDRHLAYVIYTSGSTGQPKGVMVEHRNAVNFWEVMRQTTHRDCAPRSRVALNAAFSFDMSLKGILQLLSGHCLVLIPQTIRANGPAMMDFIDRYRIDAMDSTPSQLEVLLAAGLIDKPGHRPVSVLLGGEAIGKAMWAKLKACTSTLFYNMYGPTECTVDATIVRIRDTHGGPVIGKPIANTQVYLLDAHRQPVPVGVPGELYLGGVQVARGYLNRAELTAERFLADPFSKEAGARLYKTGDLGRWLPDGTIEYLGRNDFQVKIRGFRIELGEIEAKLTACAGVREAVVIAREEASGDKRLVAYIVLSEGTEFAVTELRDALSQGLAEYMIPSAFVCMDALPLTPNGKLDRKALPAPDQSSLASRVYAAPIGDVEQTIAAIWQSLLGVERVGRNDHFFELGGHSLLAVQMVTRLREQFGTNLPLRTLFERPVLSLLSELMVSAQLDSFSEGDVADAEDELADLSESELLAMLANGVAYEH